jgi:RNA polymerase sigma-70 factor (ECF subfamily)
MEEQNKGIEKMTDTDEQLVRETRNGNKDAFEEIVKRYYQNILNFMLHFLGDRELAKDLSQECFLKLFQNIESFRGESKLDTYIYSIAKNLCFQHHRKAKVEKAFGLDSDLNEIKDDGKELLSDTAPNPLEAIINKETLSLVLKSIRSLPLEQRVVFILSERQNLSYAEIAKILKCPVGTVASRKWQAVKSLKEKLKKVLKD